MRQKRIELLKKVYEYLPESDSFKINIIVDKYTDIFNDLDPSPLKKRDLAPEFKKYIEECSHEIPLHFDLSFAIICQKETYNLKRENRAIEGIQTFCNLTIFNLDQEIHKSYKQSLQYFIIFVLLMTVALLFGPQIEGSIFTNTLLEGLSIGSWVFLWEAIDQIFLKNKKVKKSRKIYERIQNSHIEFLYL